MGPNEQLNIHLVDDDVFSAVMYGKHLKGLGYEQVTLLHDGVTCIDGLSNEPDVIFLDHEMAPWNGVKTLRRIKRHSSDTIVVLLSGQEKLNVAVDALKYGAFDYVIKGPGDLERIADVMKRIHQLRTMMKEHRSSLRARIARKLARPLNFI
ncbi:MAG: response regulator [Flavobacteriales bacterium]